MGDDAMGERRQITLREIAMMVTLLLNFGALVWGAATISNTVNSLKGTVQDLNLTVRTITADMNQIKMDYNARLRVLEDRNSR